MAKASSTLSPEMLLTLGVSMQMVDNDAFLQDVNKQNAQLQKATQGISIAANTALATAAASFAGVALATVGGIRSLIAFEDAFAGIKKTVDADAETIKKLETEVRSLATTLPVAATELARVGELGGQLGIKAGNLITFIETVTKLSVATVLSTENAALALARLGAIANIPEAQLDDFFERTASSLVDLGNNFAATEDEIITTVLRIATAAEQTGASTQDALAFATALQAIGVPSQAGGTAVSRVFQEIQRAIQSGGEQLQLFAEISGMTVTEFSRSFGEDAAMTVVRFIEGLGDAENVVQNVQNVLQKLNLSQRRTQLAIGGLAEARGLLLDTLMTARNAYEANIALEIEAAKKFNTTAQQIQLLKNQYKEFSMELGERFLPTLRQVIFSVQSMVNALDPEKAMGMGRFMFFIASAMVGVKVLTKVLLNAARSGTLFAGVMATIQAVMSSGALAIGLFVAGVAATVAAFAKIGSLIRDVNRNKDTLSLASLLGDSSDFGTGPLKAMDFVTDAIKIRKEEFEEATSIPFDLFRLEDGSIMTNAEAIADVFVTAGKNAPTENELKNYITLFEGIAGLELDKTNLANNIEEIFQGQIEKAKAGDGGFNRLVQEVFGDNADLLPQGFRMSAEQFVRDILLNGVDPVIAASEFQNYVNEVVTGDLRDIKGVSNEELLNILGLQEGTDAYEFQMDALENINTGLEARAVLEIRALERQEAIGLGLEDIAMTEEAALQIKEAAKQADIDSAAAMVEKVKLYDEENILIGMTDDAIAKKIINERNLGREEALNAVARGEMTMEEIKNMEHSASVRAALQAEKDAFAEQEASNAQKIMTALSESDTAYINTMKIAKKSAEGVINMFQKVPEQIGLSATEAVRNLEDQAAISSTFFETIQALADQGFIALAASLAEQGPAALETAAQFLADPELATRAEANLATTREAFIQGLMEIPDELELSGGELRDRLYGVGADMTSSISNGITEGAATMKEALVNALGEAINGLEIAFYYSSPPTQGPIPQLGTDAVKSIAQAVEDEQPTLEQAVIDAMQNSIDAASDFDFFGEFAPPPIVLDPKLLQKNFGTPQTFTDPMAPSTPKKYTNPYGGFLNAERRAYVAGLEEEKKVIVDSIEQYNKEVASLLNSGDSKKRFEEFKNTAKDAFKTFINFTRSLRNQADATNAVADANRNYQDELQKTIDLNDKLTKLNERMTDAVDKFGAVGVVTQSEKLDLINQELRLIKLKNAENRTGTASERLAIKDAKRELQFLEQAEKRGVATADEVQAARERLAELQGTTAGIDNFQDEESFKRILELENDKLDIQIEQQQALFDLLKVSVKEESQVIVDLQKEIDDLKADIAQQTEREAKAQRGIADAQFDQYLAKLSLIDLAQQLVNLGPKGEDQFRSIAQAVGMPESEIENLITTAGTMSDKLVGELDATTTKLFEVGEIANNLGMQFDVSAAHAQIESIEKRINNIYAKAGISPLPFPDLGIDESVVNPPAPERNPYAPLPKMLYKGGFLGLGKRALVGEFGPEIITPSPSGVRVTPTGIGGAGGGGIIVNNLNVNVTGIPADRMSARKAAVQIRKALINLEKEGNSSSITLR
jgi:TP901 family phage tail tape measure protein